ncbi:MAG: LamG-like jellyroll fold domain-containing protein [Armatimonadota bacterium]
MKRCASHTAISPTATTPTSARWWSSCWPLPPARVLDVGCAEGALGGLLKREAPCAFVAGVELHAPAAARAEAVLDEVWTTDFEAWEPLAPYERFFHCVIFGDVLEHLADPEAALHKARRLLRPDGAVVASIPNVRWLPILRDLFVRGDWVYRLAGVFEYTHLRFFTRRSMHDLSARCGFAVEACRPEVSAHWGVAGALFRRLPRWSRTCEEPCAIQHVMRAPHRGGCRTDGLMRAPKRGAARKVPMRGDDKGALRLWHTRGLVAIAIGACLLASRAGGAAQGQVAQWSFDEGRGQVATDLSGHGNDARLQGAQWRRRGAGYALDFDGVDDCVDCGTDPALSPQGAITLEAWVLPREVPDGEPVIVGKSTESYALTLYKDGQCWWYISSGGNNLRAPVQFGRWNHIVGTFDGHTMALFVNGEQMASRRSQFAAIAPGGRFSMGARSDESGRSAASHFQGGLDDVCVYDRALSAEEIMMRYRATADGYGADTTWFDRLRAVPYVFREEQRLLVLYDFRGVLPRPEDSRLEVELRAAEGGEPLRSAQFAPLPECGKVAAQLDLRGLPDPDHLLVSAALVGSGGLRVTHELALRDPLRSLQAPDPRTTVVPPLPGPPGPARFTVRVHPGGGFTIEAGGHRLPVESAYSFPGGGENRLLASEPDKAGQEGWRVETRRLADDAWEVSARGPHYAIAREIHCRSTRVEVRDTISNRTDEVLGVIVENRLDARADPFSAWWVGGYPNVRERRHSHSQSVMVAWDDLGVGLLPLDDVFIVHGTMYAREGRAGMVDDMFGLAPGASYTLEWAAYPCARGDYWDFINAVRRDEGRNGVTIEGGFAFVPRQGIAAAFVELRNLRYASFSCLTNVADDPEIEIEGIEFISLPLERARLKQQFDAIRAQHPQLKLMFHVAHSLYSTNRPDELFPDSRVLDAQGNQVLYPYPYGNGVYFSPRRHEEGWRWFIFYPTPGNSFHAAMMRAADLMMDEIGCGGVFMDGFMLGYGSPWTYDRWDGHTVEIDPETKTVTRPVGSVLLLSQPSLVEFTQRIHQKGGQVIANSPVVTRTVGRLPLVVDQECVSGPDVHLAQTSASLGKSTRIHSEADVYADVLENLAWANLYFYYGEGELTYPSLPQQMYPITTEELRAGTVIGRERIVTMNSGVYGWAGSSRLHQGFRYNTLGMPVPAEFVTSVDRSGVRTLVELEREESAVIRHIPVELRADEPVNLICSRYDDRRIVLDVNGRGPARLRVTSGDFAIEANAAYRVSATGLEAVRADAAGLLEIAVELDGPTRITIAPGAD